MDVALWQSRFGEYLGQRNYSERTIRTYGAELRPLLEFLTAQGVESLANLTRAHLEAYRTGLFYQKFKGKNLTLKTQSLRLAAVRRFVKFLVKQDYLLVDVSADMELPRLTKRLPRVVLSENETLRLLEIPDISKILGLRDRAVLEVLYATAIRNQELCDLCLDQIDWARHLVRIEHGKGDRARVVPLGQEAEIWLQEYLAKSRPALARTGSPNRVFLTSRGRQHTRDSLSRVVVRWARVAGLEKTVTPHCLRHSCATHMLKRGANLRHLQEMLGHASPDTTQIYTRVEVSDLRKVLLRCHPRERKA